MLVTSFMIKQGIIKIRFLCLLFAMCVFVDCKAFASQIEEQVKRSMRSLIPQVGCCCKHNNEIFTEDKCRYLQCMDLDEAGGQPIITTEIDSQVNEWMSNNMMEESKYLIKRIPKSNLRIDIDRKKRHEYVMEVVKELRKVVRYAYSQTVALGLSKDAFDKIAAEYKKLMQMKAWREIGDRQNIKITKATSDLRQQLERMHILNVAAYDIVLTAKRNKLKEFTQSNPTAAQNSLLKLRLKKVERRAIAAQNEALMAQQEASAARQAAINAAAEASEAKMQADAAKREADAAKWRSNNEW